MTLWLRLFWVVAAALMGRRLTALEPSHLFFHVLPNDLDINLHMNNARYLSVMDLGRADLLVRTGLWGRLWRSGAHPVLAGSVVRYRRPLAPFQRYQLLSRLVGWDERWFYIEHRIESHQAVACVALVKGTFLSPSGRLSPAEMAKLINWTAEPPPLPSWVGLWHDLDLGTEELTCVP
ncbi:MAG TPA: thioesterase family protein [Rhodospirillaceae bacterium]|nr:thioesterase family protein [Rhodospirillaceae bacterium]